MNVADRVIKLERKVQEILTKLMNIRATATTAGHHATHESGGLDAIKLDDLAAPDDNTDLDVATNKHGLAPKRDGNVDHALLGDNTWGHPVPHTHASAHGPGGGDPLKLDDLDTPDNNTDLDVTTGHHGLVPVLPADNLQFLNGQGGWSVPGGGGGPSPATSLLTFFGLGWAWGFFANGTSYASWCAPAWSVSGAGANYSKDANGNWYRLSTAATTNTLIYWYGPGFKVTCMSQNFSCIFRFKTESSIANMRIWIGMTSTNRVGGNNDNAEGSFIGLRYSSATSPNWYTVTRDGANQDPFDTGVVVQASTCYVLKIIVTGGNTVKIYINGTLVKTTTTDVPAAGTDLDGMFYAYTNENVLKSLSVGYFYGETAFGVQG